MKRFNVINYFIEKYKYKKYLEIGIDNPNNCFNKINCKEKIGVDPNKQTTFKMTSNEFFNQNSEKFDIIFIDGLHIKNQFIMDVENSINCINKNGIIICHDCRPYDEKVASPVRVSGQSWYGDVYLGWLHLRYYRRDIKMGVLPYDCGIGIIKKGVQETFPRLITDFPTYAALQNHALPIISIDEMKKEF